jgi:hypothetical protein
LTAAQIAALAPDASSLAAARQLPGRWNETGWHGTALWGLCRGSGSRPYRTIVDLGGPAYRCSCPSRKLPCKHALALLLAWSEGAVAEAPEPADFAADWIAARAARAGKPAAPAARTPNAATLEQRRARVSAGLAELDIWLCDQVRTGLAQADRSFPTFDAVAARMVDAQAPGAASALRQLSRNVAVRTDWPALLLREYSRLHLLITAHRRLDQLDPALAATVRAHVGYPTPADTVRAEPAVRDRWMVVGRRVTEEDRLHTRRVWLRGRDTARWALIIDHSFGTADFPAEMALPGTMFDADLHFYPGSAPLRALCGTRHGDPEPFTTLLAPGTTDRPPLIDSASSPPPAPGSIGAVLDEHARALGADPWLRGWPVLLTGVVPVIVDNHWYLAEAKGTALPMARLAEEPWQLSGLSGGHPIALVGEWTAEGVVPVSVFAAGDIIDVGGDPIAGTAAELDAGLTSVALLGTARRGVDPARLPGPVAAAAARGTGDPALMLLETAALQDLFMRGAVLPGRVPVPEPADDDARPMLPTAAATRLARLLTRGSPVLPEWFEAAAPHGFRAPGTLCSLLLEQAKTRAALREPLLRLAGTRGRWLASRHPQWRNLFPIELDDATVWSHGGPAARRAWLAALRRRDPRAAGTTLIAGWQSESGPARAELLPVLAEGLTLADEPLLETALDDSRAEVRRTAADLLARLPESAFAARMRQRAACWLTIAAGDRLAADLPRSLDDAARRDGVGDRLTGSAYRTGGAPDLAAGWLRRVVAATPLRHWEALFGTPDRAIRVPMADWMLGPVSAGWADAALAQRDIYWAAVLFEVLTATPTLGADLDLRRELFALLPIAERVRYLRQLDSSWLAEVELLVRAVPRPWPIELADHLIRLLLDRAHLAAARPGAPGLSPASYRTLFQTAAVHFPVDAAARVSAAARRCGDPYWQDTFDRLADDLTQRAAMLEELQ